MSKDDLAIYIAFAIEYACRNPENYKQSLTDRPWTAEELANDLCPQSKDWSWTAKVRGAHLACCSGYLEAYHDYECPSCGNKHSFREEDPVLSGTLGEIRSGSQVCPRCPSQTKEHGIKQTVYYISKPYRLTKYNADGSVKKPNIMVRFFRWFISGG